MPFRNDLAMGALIGAGALNRANTVDFTMKTVTSFTSNPVKSISVTST